MANYFNVTRSNIGNQTPGLSHIGYIAPLSWMLAIQQPAGTGGAANTTIATDHTFKASPTGLGWISLYYLPKSVEENMESNGEPGALNNVWKHKFIIPGDTPETQAMIQQLQNDDVLLLMLDASDSAGHVYQHGSERAPANIVSVKKTSGVKGSGVKGWEIEVEAIDRFFYTGAITAYSGSV